ncbi:MAG: hypothetical protein WDN31_09750 [Hyphomicrobium sp.]
MVIEEGSIPSALAPILPALFTVGADKFGDDTDRGVLDFIAERARRRQSLLFGAYQGAINRTQTYLVMSHDDGKGRISLDEGRVEAFVAEGGGAADLREDRAELAQGDAGDGRELHAQSAHRDDLREEPHHGAPARRLASWGGIAAPASSTTSARCSTGVPRRGPTRCSPGYTCATGRSSRVRSASIRY